MKTIYSKEVVLKRKKITSMLLITLEAEIHLKMIMKIKIITIIIMITIKILLWLIIKNLLRRKKTKRIKLIISPLLKKRVNLFTSKNVIIIRFLIYCVFLA